MIQELKAKAADHWQDWLPEKWAELVAQDRVDQALTEAATKAEQEIRELMSTGYRLDEAEDVVLPELILLEPENPNSTGNLELDAEIEEREEAYQEAARKEAAEMKEFRMQQEVDEGTPRALAELQEAHFIPWSQVKGGEKGWHDRQLEKELKELRKYR